MGWLLEIDSWGLGKDPMLSCYQANLIYSRSKPSSSCRVLQQVLHIVNKKLFGMGNFG